MQMAVVDDEKAIREQICTLIEEQQPGSRIESYAAGEELLASGKRFDIVFLDIQMEGMNGIEVARNLRKQQGDTILIFITGIKDYVFDALDLYAFQYLLKPLDEIRFGDVFRRAAEKIAACEGQQGRPLIIQSAGVSRVVALPDIYYIESQSHKLLLHLRDGCLEYYGRWEIWNRSCKDASPASTRAIW